MYLAVMMLGWASLPAMVSAVELNQDKQSDQVILSNDIVSLAFDMSNGTFTITDKATGKLMIDQAAVAADSWNNTDGMSFTGKQEEVNDALGHGHRLVVTMEHPGTRAIPVYLFSFTLYDGRGGVVMGFWHAEYYATRSPVNEGFADGTWTGACRKVTGSAANTQWGCGCRCPAYREGAEPGLSKQSPVDLHG